MNGLSVAVADIQSAVKAAVKAQGLEASELKIYVNANEQAAYYTVDGQGGESYKVDPVSYTHLDVYKRQVPVTAVLKMWFRQILQRF